MKDTTRARDQQVSGPASVQYPDHIKLSEHAENYLNQLGIDLVTADVNLEQLPPSLLQLYVIAFEQGRASLQPALDAANHDADRYYAEMCRRLPPKTGWQDYAELSHIRGEHERAKRAEERDAYIQASIEAEAAKRSK